MNKNWTKVFSSDDPIEAEIIKHMLENNSNDNLKVITMNKQDSSYKFGTIDLYVENKNIQYAKKIIRLYHEQSK
tara:strand:- start:124 stop:345 length:222 start_codon:yes stop_codon:yes gene_type:complete